MSGPPSPLILAAGLSPGAVLELGVALAPWAPIEEMADVLSLLARAREGGASLVLLPADKTEGVGAAERLRRTAQGPVVCLVGEGGLSQRFVRHWLSPDRAQICLGRPVPTDFLRRRLEQLLPVPVKSEEVGQPLLDPPPSISLPAPRDERGTELEALRLSELQAQIEALETARSDQNERLARKEAELHRASEAREADRLALAAAREREGGMHRSLTTLEARWGAHQQEQGAQNTALNEALREREAMIRDLRAARKDQEAALSQALARESLHAAEIQEQRVERERSRVEYAALRVEAASGRAEVSELRALLSRREAAFHQMESTEADLRRLIAEHRTELDLRQVAFEEAKAEASGRALDLAAAREEANRQTELQSARLTALELEKEGILGAQTTDLERLSLIMETGRTSEIAAANRESVLWAELNLLRRVEGDGRAEADSLRAALEVAALEIAAARDEAEQARQAASNSREEAERARSDATLARDEALTDLQWFLGELARLRGGAG